MNTQEIASTNSSKREKVMNYMKECVDFQLELGGKQVLVCWGCGVYESNVLREENWLNSVKMIQEFGRWADNRKILVDLEMDPHVYFVVGSMEKMAKMLEDVNLPNVFPNVDIGHMCITREAPQVLKNLKIVLFMSILVRLIPLNIPIVLLVPVKRILSLILKK